MKNLPILILGWALTAVPAFAADGSDALLTARLEAHVRFLADDLLRGRQPGTAGYDIAANYVASQFRQMGLAPAGTDGGYFQPVPLRRAWLQEGSAAMAFEHAGESRPLRFVDEFYMGPGMSRAVTDVTAPLVFAGYGIVSPLLEHDDYAGLDVAGKIVLLLSGMPSDFPSEVPGRLASKRT